MLALLGLTQGELITPWANLLRRWLGAGGIFIVVGLGITGLMLLRKHFSRIPKISWGRVLALELAAFSFITMLTVWNGNDLARAEAGLDGGQVGWGLAEILGIALGDFLRNVLLVTVFAITLLIGLGLQKDLGKWLRRVLEGRPIEADIAATVNPGEGVSVSPVDEQNKAAPSLVKKRKPVKLEPQYRKNLMVDSKEDSNENAPPPPRADDLPPLTLLVRDKANKPNERTINLTAGLIEKTLADFGIPAKVTGVQVGPTVTQFALEPGYIEVPTSEEDEIRQKKVRVAQISRLQKDMALALSATRLRIEAPVPGRSYVGIEVPNDFSAEVRLRDILESDAFFKLGKPLGVALGRDVSGEPVVTDLARMPHLLIAGTTGSGKSVCISAITACLVMNNTPEQLRLVMIDPKKVELVRFNGLPHLLGKVETDLDRIMGVLRWTVMEMDRRYKLLETYRARDINSFNNKMAKRKNPPEPQMPRIVVLIDELADLMMSAADQTEPALVRLAQLARAIGIHLVVATQRPSTDVVTGLIKANFPARLAFNVASSIDSRVILDQQGAETLLGKGDMLFQHPEAPAPMRAQGVLVTDKEIEKIITYWSKHYEADMQGPTPWDVLLAEEEALAERDELINRAIEIVQTTQRASASHLQRRLRIGYPRAARLIDELEALGMIGPNEGVGREREVLIGPDDEV
jgi:S-DNA-T family DNA segregation ATPase FtsK/SpoIIIE